VPQASAETRQPPKRTARLTLTDRALAANRPASRAGTRCPRVSVCGARAAATNTGTVKKPPRDMLAESRAEHEEKRCSQ
jgi:hypothetical protein